MLEKTSEIFRLNLRRLRKSKFSSQSKFAEAVDLSVRGYQKYEQGESSPTPEMLEKFASALGCEPWQLLFPDSETEPIGEAPKTVPGKYPEQPAEKSGTLSKAAYPAGANEPRKQSESEPGYPPHYISQNPNQLHIFASELSDQILKVINSDLVAKVVELERRTNTSNLELENDNLRAQIEQRDREIKELKALIGPHRVFLEHLKDTPLDLIETFYDGAEVPWPPGSQDEAEEHKEIG